MVGNLENVGYLAEKDGLKLLVEDMHQLTTMIRNNNPVLPLFLFGHSMGSFAAQRYMMLYGKELKGVILSGSNGSQTLLHKVGLWIYERSEKDWKKDKKR